MSELSYRALATYILCQRPWVRLLETSSFSTILCCFKGLQTVLVEIESFITQDHNQSCSIRGNTSQNTEKIAIQTFRQPTVVFISDGSTTYGCLHQWRFDNLRLSSSVMKTTVYRLSKRLSCCFFSVLASVFANRARSVFLATQVLIASQSVFGP